MRTCLPLWGALAFLLSCRHSGSAPEQRREAIAGIQKAEGEFAAMVEREGIAAGFVFFADTAAVIKRGNDSLISGREGIRNYYSAPYFRSARVRWSPDFTDASPDGKMGYTYGHYEWESADSSGRKDTSRGVFHTVWKKQGDGSWKYVWD